MTTWLGGTDGQDRKGERMRVEARRAPNDDELCKVRSSPWAHGPSAVQPERRRSATPGSEWQRPARWAVLEAARRGPAEAARGWEETCVQGLF